MIYLYGVLALVLSLFEFILFRIAVKGKSVYHNVAMVIFAFAAPFTGYYVVAFVLELFKFLTSFGSSLP
jgi:hypothetical protein